jgi:hypothetical protein
MNVKIQSQGIAGGHNSGSCGGYAAYLEHENIEKAEAGMADQQIPFFDPYGRPVERKALVQSVDMNTTQLHRDDAKFYSVILSFSEDEIKSMGGSRDEILASVHNVVERTMDQYAMNFHCDGVKSHADLKYYYTMHEYRNGFTPGLHVHVIVSRKDATNRFKLSPMTNHRGESTGVIKRGFDRDSFYRSCEKIFDNATGFDRSPDQSYDYFNAMKHGSVEQREALIREVFKDTVQEVSENVINLVESMANEAHVPEMQREYLRQMQAEPAEKRAMNRFWNTYHSYYRPLLESVKESCNSAFQVYCIAKEGYGVCSDKISERYNRLKAVYAEINRLQSEISNAKTSKMCIKLFSLLIAVVNPAPAIILALLGSIITDAQKRASIIQLRNLATQAKRIKADIEQLKVKQEGLKMAKDDTLKSYIAVKDEKENLKSEISALRRILENTSGASKEIFGGMGELMMGGRFVDEVATAHREGSGDLGFRLYEIFSRSKDRLSLDYNLFARNFSCDPVYHSNGGVADLKIIHKGEKFYASELFRPEILVSLLNKWACFTGQRPAYKVAALQETKERMLQAQQQSKTQKMKM